MFYSIINEKEAAPAIAQQVNPVPAPSETPDAQPESQTVFLGANSATAEKTKEGPSDVNKAQESKKTNSITKGKVTPAQEAGAESEESSTAYVELVEPK